MANVFKGGPECTIGGVVLTLKRSRDCVELWKNFKLFTLHLGTCPMKAEIAIERLQKNAESFVEVTCDILTDWRSRKPHKCSLQELYNILCSCELVSLDEHLRKEYARFEIEPAGARQLPIKTFEAENQIETENQQTSSTQSSMQNSIHSSHPTEELSCTPESTFSEVLTQAPVNSEPSSSCSFASHSRKIDDQVNSTKPLQDEQKPVASSNTEYSSNAIGTVVNFSQLLDLTKQIALWHQEMTQQSSVTNSQCLTRSQQSKELLIGNKGVKIELVARTLHSTDGKTLLRKNILSVMIELGTEEDFRNQIVKNLKHDEIELLQAILDVLYEWTTRAPTEATVQELVRVLESCDLCNQALTLKNEFLNTDLQ